MTFVDSGLADARTVVALAEFNRNATEIEVQFRLRHVMRCAELHANLPPGEAPKGCRAGVDRLCGDPEIIRVTRVGQRVDAD